MKISCGRYPFFDLGITLMWHRHCGPKHGHIIFDLGLWFIELTLGSDMSDEELKEMVK